MRRRRSFAVKILTAVIALIMQMSMTLMINAQDDREATDFQAKHPNGILISGKILSIDPIKGDMSIRLEFFPNGDLIKEDGTLAKTIKFDTESSNGKQEVTFEKGKRMHATEVVLNMYGDTVESYPVDTHKADLFLYFLTKSDKKKESSGEQTADESEVKKEAEAAEPSDYEIPHLLSFQPNLSGFKITSEKNKDSDESYTSLNLTISRSSMVKLFSAFIMMLMWGLSLAVFALVVTVVILGRKAELAMFSFIATLLFAFVTVRNSQPGVPPVGTTGDMLSFFWAEGILGLCLLAVVLTWVFRKPA